MNEDTIEQKDIIPLSLYFVSQMTGVKDKGLVIYRYDNNTIEDLAMMAVLLILKTEPNYLTGAYIRRVVQTVLRDASRKKKLNTISLYMTDDEGNEGIINVPELTTSEDHDALSTYLAQMMEVFTDNEKRLLKLLIEEDMTKEETAEYLGVSRMTVFRTEQSIKDKIKEYYGN